MPGATAVLLSGEDHWWPGHDSGYLFSVGAGRGRQWSRFFSSFADTAHADPKSAVPVTGKAEPHSEPSEKSPKAHSKHGDGDSTSPDELPVAAPGLGEDLRPLFLDPRDLSDVQEMCKTIGVKDLNALMEEAIPASVRREQDLDLPDGGLGESGSLALLKDMLSKNVVAKNFIGMGYHGSHLPGPILRNLLENPGWYTAYTPYQAEISQGRLESLVNFQTLVCELTGMEVANASLLDEGAEGLGIARAVNSKSKNQFFISDAVHPQTIDCLKTRAHYFGMARGLLPG
eukprot:s731_g7.t1